MPHIHTEPDQHDMTVSAYIIRTDSAEPKVLVHMHRKHNKLLQIGGHIELDETPWHAMAREVAEESGYTLEDLEVLQPDAEPVEASGAIVHPVPVLSNTHKISDTHYHSDLCYAFVADHAPRNKLADGESEDLRWLTLAELQQEVGRGVAARDVGVFYEAIVSRYLPRYARVPASRFSVAKPADMSM